MECKRAREVAGLRGRPLTSAKLRADGKAGGRAGGWGEVIRAGMAKRSTGQKRKLIGVFIKLNRWLGTAG